MSRIVNIFILFLLLFLFGLVGATSPAFAVNVGYYDMTLEAGNPTQVPPILIAGETPVELDDLTAGDLVGIDVLFVQNPDNGSFGSEYLSRMGNIEDAVAAGMVLIIHDRFVDTAETILPGGAGFIIIRDFSDDANIEILNDTTLVTNGPGGVLDNTSLDDGNSSSHGYTLAGSLPGNAVKILSRTDPSEIVTMCYQFQQGSVIYSSIPLDFYLNGSGNNPPRDNMTDIYAPNIIAFAVNGVCFEALDIPTLSEWGLITMVTILGIVGFVAIKMRRQDKLSIRG